MKIAIEIQPMLDKQMTGIGWYVDNLVKNIKYASKDEELYYLLGMDYYNRAGRLEDYTNNNISLKTNGIMHYGIYRRIWNLIPFIDYGAFFKVKADVYHFVNYVVPPYVKGKKINTVYDMVYKTFPETMDPENYKKLDKGLRESCNRSDAIVTISENSKKEIASFLNIPDSKIHIISPGVDTSVYRPMQPSEYINVISKYNLPNKYLLYLGTIEPRKNIAAIIRAYHSFVSMGATDYKLVIAGKKGWMFEQIFSLVKELNIEDKVIFPGYVQEEDKPYIYAGAAAFLFPSLYEGFGMPPLEAMACGVPVITSDTSSLPEVVGDAGILVQPTDVDGISKAIYNLVSQPELRNRLSEKGLSRAESFSWGKSTEKLINLYRQLAD